VPELVVRNLVVLDEVVSRGSVDGVLPEAALEVGVIGVYAAVDDRDGGRREVLRALGPVAARVVGLGPNLVDRIAVNRLGFQESRGGHGTGTG
jgi:hypothetical protein